jgi:ABC-type arginine transport system permease subunit
MTTDDLTIAGRIHGTTFLGAYTCHWKGDITSKKTFGMHKTWEMERISLLV